MPLFRFHRGGLDESLKTTIIVKNITELKLAILDNYSYLKPQKTMDDFDVHVTVPYGLSLKETFDKRCGWYSQMVSSNYTDRSTFNIEGYLSEPMDASPPAAFTHVLSLLDAERGITIKVTPDLKGWDGTVSCKKENPDILTLKFNTDFVEKFEQQFHQ